MLDENYCTSAISSKIDNHYPPLFVKDQEMGQFFSIG